MSTAVEMTPGSLEQWSLHKAELSRQAFIKRFPHPFLLLGEEAREAEPDFFTGTITHNQEFSGYFTEEHEVVPIIKGPGNPYAHRIIVGRVRTCDIVFRTTGVSKVHAEFHVHDLERAELVDRGSTNGTFVRGELAMAGERVSIKSGDVVRFGLLLCLFLGPGPLYDRF